MLEVKPLAIREDQIIDAVADRVIEQAQERIDTAVRGAVKAALEEKLKELVDEALRPMVAQVIADGWQRTNNYGEPVGPKMDLKARVSEMLNANDSYDRTPFIQKTAKEVLDSALRKELGEQIEEAKKKFRAQVDGVLQAKFHEALASSLGLRT